jgi:hypothetical protein
MSERYTTLGGSTLDGAINNSVTSLDVASASSFPAAGDFRIRIDDEILKVTGVSGVTFTVVRGQEGTSAASHVDASVITEVLTQAALDAIRSDIHQVGAFSSRPSASGTGGAQGNVYVPNDGPGLFVANGGAWRSIGPNILFTTPVLTDYTWQNQGSATAVDGGDHIRMIAPASASSNIRAMAKAYTAPKSFAIIFSGLQHSGNFSGMGLFLRDSATGRIMLFGAINTNTESVEVSRHTSYTAFNSDAHSQIYRIHAPYMMRKIEDDGTTLSFYISLDGSYWHLLHSETRATFLANPNQVGFYTNSLNSRDVIMNVYSIAE